MILAEYSLIIIQDFNQTNVNGDFLFVNFMKGFFLLKYLKAFMYLRNIISFQKKNINRKLRKPIRNRVAHIY